MPRFVVNQGICRGGIGGLICALLLGCQEHPAASPPSAPATTTVDPAATAADWSKLLESTRAAGHTHIFFDQPLSNAQVAQLSALPELKVIELPRAACDSDAWEKLLSITQLQILRLGETNLTDADFAKLRSSSGLCWPELTQLNLASCQAGNSALQIVSEHPRLELLCWRMSDVEDAGLAALAKCGNLRFLILTRARITGVGLLELAKLPRLESLYLAGNPLREEYQIQLQHERPDLHPDW
ncbi:MAG: leucine-rich repeat domain-containing protein [Pirellulales bacterium]|nr:leucine-rich repeat domain-containing protein [Pirellulales bacterium]